MTQPNLEIETMGASEVKGMTTDGVATDGVAAVGLRDDNALRREQAHRSLLSFAAANPRAKRLIVVEAWR